MNPNKMEKQYKITMPEARLMTEVPTEDFRYIYPEGFFSNAFEPWQFNTYGSHAIGWIPANVKVEEIIVPGWCEYENDKHFNEVRWRYASGLVSISYPTNTLPVNPPGRFVRQLTFGPQENSK